VIEQREGNILSKGAWGGGSVSTNETIIHDVGRRPPPRPPPHCVSATRHWSLLDTMPAAAVVAGEVAVDSVR
jgi:hypothetical protein